jgi:DNA polymerase sigma
MIDKSIVEKTRNELSNGLIQLYMQKEQVDEQIKAQRVAIEQCTQILKMEVDNNG